MPDVTTIHTLPTRAHMRGRMALTLVIVAAVTSATGTARARKKKSKVAAAVVDISAIKDTMVILTDGEGRTLAVSTESSSYDQAFYSEDGKTFYQLRVRGGGINGGTGEWNVTLWSPRVDVAEIARKAFKAGETPQWALTCKRDWDDNDEEPLTALPAADAKKIIEHATFRPPFWDRQAHFLARDDAGNYYYVDRLRSGGKGFRLFRGPKGSMKEMAMTNVVSDSVGEIFTTKKGELRFVVTDGQAKWVFGSKSMELTKVPVEDNVPLIYGDLGVYLGTLGTPCDDA